VVNYAEDDPEDVPEADSEDDSEDDTEDDSAEESEDEIRLPPRTRRHIDSASRTNVEVLKSQTFMRRGLLQKH